jgi:hypothetical protein
MDVRHLASHFDHAVLRAALAPAAVLSAYLAGWAVGGEAVRWPPLNMALHLAGGLAVAHLVAAVLAPVLAPLSPRLRGRARAAGLLALTSTVAVAWEFLECVVARVLDVRGPSGSPDTLVDIALGMTGALAYAVVAHWRSRPGPTPVAPRHAG